MGRTPSFYLIDKFDRNDYCIAAFFETAKTAKAAMKIHGLRVFVINKFIINIFKYCLSFDSLIIQNLFYVKHNLLSTTPDAGHLQCL